jgi:hypothetical protein
MNSAEAAHNKAICYFYRYGKCNGKCKREHLPRTELQESLSKFIKKYRVCILYAFKGKCAGKDREKNICHKEHYTYRRMIGLYARSQNQACGAAEPRNVRYVQECVKCQLKFEDIPLHHSWQERHVNELKLKTDKTYRAALKRVTKLNRKVAKLKNQIRDKKNEPEKPEEEACWLINKLKKQSTVILDQREKEIGVITTLITRVFTKHFHDVKVYAQNYGVNDPHYDYLKAKIKLIYSRIITQLNDVFPLSSSVERIDYLARKHHLNDPTDLDNFDFTSFHSVISSTF